MFLIFVMRAQLVLMAGRAGRYVFLLLRKQEIYLLDVHKPHRSVFKNNESVVGWKLARSSVAHCKTFFFEREKMKKSNKCKRIRQQERTERGTVMFLWE